MSAYARNDFRPRSSAMIRCLVDVFSRPLSAVECVELPSLAGYGATIRGLEAGSDQSFTLNFVGPKGLVPSVAGGSWDMGRAISWVARAIDTSPQRLRIFSSLGQVSPTLPALTALRVEGVSNSGSLLWPSEVEVPQLSAGAEAEWVAMVLGARLPESQARSLTARL